MAKKITNPETKVPATTKLNDKDIINIILTLEKNFTNNMSISLNEASNNELYKIYFAQFKEAQDMQRQLFDLAFKNGWYPLEEAEKTKVIQKHSDIKKQLSELT